MYLMRLDDAAENWNKEIWHRMYDLLNHFHVKPIVAIIPHNEDSDLLKYPYDVTFWDTIRTWVGDGWTPALHGYNHVYITKDGGINPVNHRSEFAGVPLEVQREKISNGYRLLKECGITPKVFVAPSHTFDENTLTAIKMDTDIRVISDTIADDVYCQDGMYFIPQQSGSVRKLPFRIVTFCYHPNIMTENSFDELEEFLKKYSSRFMKFEDIPLKKRKLNIIDEMLRRVYFSRK